jgi:hypothetical protein
MGGIRSLLKYRKLRRISRILGAGLETEAFIRELQSGRPSKRDRALEELLDLCESDPILLSAGARHNATRSDLRKIYEILLATGAGQWEGGLFVPVATLGSPFALDFVLTNRDRRPWEEIAVLLLEYFERHESGPVPSEVRGPANPSDSLRAVWELEQRARHRDEESVMKRPLGWIAGIAFLVGAVVLYNVWFHASYGSPTIPRLEDRWWAGYYDTKTFGRQWCLVRFAKTPSGELQMALLSKWGPAGVFQGTRSSSGENFVQLQFKDPNSDLRIEGKQLYLGKRYYLGRLFAGRFSDFWKMNDDVAIRGEVVSWFPPNEFAIEPIEEERIERFWTQYVRPEGGDPSPSELLRALGREVQRRLPESRGVR